MIDATESPSLGRERPERASSRIRTREIMASII